MRFLIARKITLVVSSSVWRLSDDPVDFLEKVSLRFRGFGCQNIARFLYRLEIAIGKIEPTGQRQIRQGNLSDGLRWFAAQPTYYRLFHSRKVRSAKDRLEFLQETVSRTSLERKNSANANPQGRRGVLFLLTNSLPYTQSGYTIRSHKTLQAISLKGIAPIVFTRIGYPTLVGKRIDRDTVTIDEIKYRQLIPWRLSPSLEVRTRATVKMVLSKLDGQIPQAIVTTTDFKNAMVARNLASELGVPWIYEVRGELESTWAAKQELSGNADARKSELYSLLRDQEIAAMKAADRVIVLSKVYKERLINRGIPKGRIAVIPNGVTEDDFLLYYDEAEVLRQRYSIPDKPMIGTITSIVGYEGLNLLVRAVARLDEIHCVIVGDGEELGGLREEADRLGVSDRITFVGRVPVEDVNHWYSMLDLFVVPRLDIEVCRVVTPLKPLQAMAKGIPVVGSDLPALQEITGGLMRSFRPGDLADFVNAICLELDSPHLKDDLIQWAKEHTWKSNAGRYERLLNELSDGKEMVREGKV